MDTQAYAEANDLDEEDTETLHFHIAKMDQAFLKKIEDKKK
jgi:hypothetical protein